MRFCKINVLNPEVLMAVNVVAEKLLFKAWMPLFNKASSLNQISVSSMFFSKLNHFSYIVPEKNCLVWNLVQGDIVYI